MSDLNQSHGPRCRKLTTPSPIETSCSRTKIDKGGLQNRTPNRPSFGHRRPPLRSLSHFVCRRPVRRQLVNVDSWDIEARRSMNLPDMAALKQHVISRRIRLRSDFKLKLWKLLKLELSCMMHQQLHSTSDLWALLTVENLRLQIFTKYLRWPFLDLPAKLIVTIL